MRRSIVTFLFLLGSLQPLAQSFAAESGPTVSILSPASGLVQKGKVTISGIATPDPSGTSKINEIGIKVVGLQNAGSFDTREIVYDATGERSNQTSWKFGSAGVANAVWNIESSDGKFSFSWDSTPWPNQTYEVTLFAKDFNERASASKPVQFKVQTLSPTVSILSPASGSVQKGKVTISGIATPDPSGTSKINYIGIKVVGKGTAEGYDTWQIVYDRTGEGSLQSGWKFGKAGVADGVWSLESSDGKFSFSWDISEWPNQTYEIVLFASDFNERAAASKPITIIKKPGTIPIIDLKVSCELSNPSYVGSQTFVYCKSKQEVPKVPVELQYLTSGAWKTFSKNNFYSGTGATYPLTFKAEGTTQFRVISSGLMKQESPYRINPQVKPFVSNVLLIETKKLSNSTSSSSSAGKNSSTSKSSNRNTSSNSSKTVVVPNFVGMSVELLQKNRFKFPGITIFIAGSSCKISDVLSGTAIIVSQSVEPLAVRRSPAFVTVRTNC